MTDSLRKDLKEMNADSMIIIKLRDQWLSEGVHQFTEGGNMKLSFRKRIIEWVLDGLSQLSKENIIKSSVVV